MLEMFRYTKTYSNMNSSQMKLAQHFSYHIISFRNILPMKLNERLERLILLWQKLYWFFASMLHWKSIFLVFNKVRISNTNNSSFVKRNIFQIATLSRSKMNYCTKWKNLCDKHVYSIIRIEIKKPKL